jgi:DUF218 domain
VVKARPKWGSQQCWRDKTFVRLIFVLGSPNADDGTLSDISLGRIQRAVQEQQASPGTIILATGGFGAHFNTTDIPHRELVYRQLNTMGATLDRADATDLLSSNTVEDISLIGNFAVVRGAMAYGVVTSEFHADRCRFILRCIVPGHLVSILTAKDPSDLTTEIVNHEKRALALLTAQGGVLLEGILHPLPDESTQ